MISKAFNSAFGCRLRVMMYHYNAWRIINAARLDI